MITFDRKGNPILETEVTIPYELALGPVWYRFFEGLKEEKIWGTKCPNCGRVLVPARAFCPRCFVNMEEWVQVSPEGVVEGWVFVNYEYFGMPVKPPYIMGSIRLDGSDCAFVHMIGGFDLTNIEDARKRVWSGVRVRAVWRERKLGTILDIKYFKPIS